MKYIKKLNIDFDNWEEINYIDIQGSLVDVYNLLKMNDRVNVSFRKEKNYNDEWGIIKFKSNDSICINFNNNINGHDGGSNCEGTIGHCWCFSKSVQYNLYIKKLIR